MRPADAHELVAKCPAARHWRLPGGCDPTVRSEITLRRRDELFLRVPDEVLIDWVRVHGAEGANALAQTLGPPEVGPVPPVVRFLLKEYMEEVDATPAMNFRSGSWTGSEVSYWSGRSRLRAPG
jgi:hypothetical protein